MLLLLLLLFLLLLLIVFIVVVSLLLLLLLFDKCLALRLSVLSTRCDYVKHVLKVSEFAPSSPSLSLLPFLSPFSYSLFCVGTLEATALRFGAGAIDEIEN